MDIANLVLELAKPEHLIYINVLGVITTLKHDCIDGYVGLDASGELYYYDKKPMPWADYGWSRGIGGESRLLLNLRQFININEGEFPYQNVCFPVREILIKAPV